MAQTPIFVDLTPWSRGPHTGVGLTALHSFNAIEKSLSHNELYRSQFKLHGVTRSKTHPPYQKLSLFRRWQGWRESIFHSFELKLPTVRKCRKVITVHDVWSLSPNNFQSAEFQRTQGSKLKKSIFEADHIAVPSSCVKNQIVARFPNLRTPISVVPWGPTVQPQNTVPDSKEVIQYLNQDRPFLLCVATIEKRKNYELLLEAFTPQIAKQIDLVTVGQLGFGGESVTARMGPMRQNYLKGIDLKQASYSDLQCLYSRCSGLILVSQDEGFGIPVLEALYFGKPIIASKIPSLIEIADSNARYVSLDSGKNELLLAIQDLLSSPWTERDMSKSKIRASQFT